MKHCSMKQLFIIDFRRDEMENNCVNKCIKCDWDKSCYHSFAFTQQWINVQAIFVRRKRCASAKIYSLPIRSYKAIRKVSAYYLDLFSHYLAWKKKPYFFFFLLAFWKSGVSVERFYSWSIEGIENSAEFHRIIWIG